MPEHLTGYPKIYTLDNRNILELFSGNVIIQEKFDGSQFSFGLRDGVAIAHSRGGEIDIQNPQKLFASAVDTVVRLRHSLVEDCTYRGEVVATPKHNVLKYSRAAKGAIVLFDVQREDRSYAGPDGVRDTAQILGLEPCPTFYNGPGSGVTLHYMEDLLKLESSLGGNNIEGIVIKNYSVFDPYGCPLLGKLVRPEFKEAMGAKKPKVRPDICQELISCYRTEARWRKAIQHLREAGELSGEMKDIGKVLKEVSSDLLAEEGDALRELLFKRFWSEISKGVCRGFADFYKMELANLSVPGYNGPLTEGRNDE